MWLTKYKYNRRKWRNLGATKMVQLVQRAKGLVAKLDKLSYNFGIPHNRKGNQQLQVICLYTYKHTIFLKKEIIPLIFLIKNIQK